MNKSVLALGTALSIFALTPAIAQETPATPEKGIANTMQTGTTDLFVPADRLNSSQVMSASDYIGKAVYDETGSNIGEVNDLIISQAGDVQAVILGVGGFLGMGEKDVAVSVNAVKMVQDGDAQRLVVQATRESLESAPAYDRDNRRYSGGGMVPGDQTGSITPAPGGADNDPNTPQ
ncbi:PRC-barrel domain-containing protein [Aestuariivirga sp.]|uniref:PRC-barrel domain-containing protein n=1 Tax=Aestuariivirga sp. TaxID=2650926 RepID=UPI00359380BE